MKIHTANELISRAEITGPDSAQRANNVPCGITDLTGKLVRESQFGASESSHLILFRTLDVAGALDASCYVLADGLVFIVDYQLDPRKPRPGVWTEVYCHVETGGGKSNR